MIKFPSSQWKFKLFVFLAGTFEGNYISSESAGLALHSSVGGRFDRQANDSSLTQRQDFQTRWLRQLLWLLYHFTGQSYRLANRLDTDGRED